MKRINKFFYKLWFEWLKITYKPTQFYYTNKIQSHEKVGAGQVFVFCNKISELAKLRHELNLPKGRLYEVENYPAIKLIGSEISKARQLSEYKNLPKYEIISILRKQKTDKI